MMAKVFIGNKKLKRCVEIRVVELKTNKSKSFSISMEEDTKSKNYDIKKIKDLLQELLDDCVRKKGWLVLK